MDCVHSTSSGGHGIGAELAAEVAMYIMTEKLVPDKEIIVRAGMKVELGSEDAMYLDEEFNVVKLVTSDPSLLKGEAIGCVPYGWCKVYIKNRVVGHVIGEPLTTLRDGVIIDLSGQKEFPVPIKLYKKVIEELGLRTQV
mgnify:CR=1 FL=1